jgi:hypothetical protein
MKIRYIPTKKYNFSSRLNIVTSLAVNMNTTMGTYMHHLFFELLQKNVSLPISGCSKIGRHEKLDELITYNSLTSTF